MTMLYDTTNRRSFLKGLGALLGGLGAVTLVAKPAHAGRSHWRGGYGGFGGYGYGGRRSGIRRFYGGGYGGYGGFQNFGGFGGYGGYAPPYYNPGYYMPYQAPVMPVQPYYYNNYYYPPFGKLDTPRAIDALRLLEA
ncbi:MAG: hypothetical protein NVSMB9_00600 [Isosphaeraceae bacterium]